MKPDERRTMIVRAALPLVVEHGASVTTAQIARAAGIGEGTIFRAFADKDELLDACLLEALRPDSALELIAGIPLDQPLAARLAAAAGALSAHLRRMGAVHAALRASGYRRRLERPRREASLAATRAAVAALFAPEEELLRLPAEQLGALFLSLLFTRAREDEGSTEIDVLVDVFLHGAVTDR
ncbi:TetR/AcrR family transcriptional regulator [Actinophytocola oryzae]|uniref:TetR family transcriptional regulator n=1 Tax=Actinophytocola oryzae TaxID=502181 RepID=A0A4R7W164_9PSEU|nr:helix-turn-helix domain-containing protein [Actinophytocola oryzae]TDV56152.1 TetR family transcriptional regulator [Actinophytocola oryzae]